MMHLSESSLTAPSYSGKLFNRSAGEKTRRVCLSFVTKLTNKNPHMNFMRNIKSQT